MGVFIQIDIAQSEIESELAEKIVSLCPVEVFAVDRGKLNAKPDREDECTLCKLCLDAAPAGAVVIRKMYRDEQLISRGGKS